MWVKKMGEPGLGWKAPPGSPSPTLPKPDPLPTQHAQAADLVHEQGRDNVSGEHGQGAQEADKVDHVGVVVVAEVQLAALLVVQECAVHHPAIDELVLKEICGESGPQGHPISL